MYATISRYSQERLWEAVLAGDIDMIVSDHSPCTPDLKMPGEKDFMAAWGGISSLQFGLTLHGVLRGVKYFSKPLKMDTS